MFIQVLEPIDDIKVQVQINTVTMRQIKDMLTKESTENTVMSEKIFKLIEDLRNDIMNKATPAACVKPKTSTNTSINTEADIPQKFAVKIQEPPIAEDET